MSRNVGSWSWKTSRAVAYDTGMKPEPRRVGILVYDGVTALDVVGPGDAFASALRPARKPDAEPESAYEVVTIGVGQRRCRAESGLLLHAHCALAEAPALDTLVIPGGSGLRRPPINDRVADWIRRRARRVRRVASICTGIYGLAATGLLDGRRVTTHWRHAEAVAARFPRLDMQPNAIFVKDGRFYTSAGVTAGIDLSLSLIEEDLGARVALEVARELVVYLHRAGGQDQFSEPLRFQAATPDRFSELVAFVSAHLDADLSVEALARRVGVSPRQLTRQCNQALGCSPAALVKRVRLDEAKARLLRSSATVDLVASSLGFASADVFRRAFEKRFGVNPSAFRARFGSRGHERTRSAP